MDAPASTITLTTGGTLAVAETLEQVAEALAGGGHVRLNRTVRTHGGWLGQPVVVSAAHVVCVEPAV